MYHVWNQELQIEIKHQWSEGCLLQANLSLNNNLPTFRLNAPVVITFAMMTTEALSWNVGKLFSKLKLVTDNLLFIYAEANWEATETYQTLFHDVVQSLYCIQSAVVQSFS